MHLNLKRYIFEKYIMDVDVPILAGWIGLVPTQSGFSLYKKKPCHRYCLLFKSSRHGIERLEICESKDDKNPKIITLENCVKITQEPGPTNLIQIVKKTGTLNLNTLTEDDLKEWLTALQSVAFRDKSSGSLAALEEDNDLYCSSFGDGFFIVTLTPSETSIRCNIEPKTYMLHLNATELQLKSTEDLNVVISTWPYRFIRKYGYRDGKFTFEAGRKCSTGEGVFTLDHTNPQEVFRCMSAKMKTMKKFISGDNANSIECPENLLIVAASMEAGSRSPLPPSPSNQRSLEFETNSTQSCVSLRGFISSNDSLSSFSINSSANNSSPIHPGKPIPNKPPRTINSSQDMILSSSTHIIPPSTLELKSHNQPINDKYKHFQSYEAVTITTSADPNKTVGSTVILKPTSPNGFRKPSALPELPVRKGSVKTTTERDYECIETITDAWKTLGISDIKHTERSTQSAPMNGDLIDFDWQRDISPSVKKIINIDIGESDNCMHSIVSDATYDRLDFLSPNNKNSSGYKTVVAVTLPGNQIRSSLVSTNDYELIASPDIQTCRTADDSHLGYGVLRKSTTNLEATESITDVNPSASSTLIATVGQSSSVIPRLTTDYNDLQLDHRSYNGFNYTIVSKPKRV